MPNIVFFIYNISAVGGTERVASVIINELAKRNYNVHVLGLYGDPDKIFFPFEPNVKVTSLHIEDLKGVRKILYSQHKIRQFVNSNHIDTFVTVESIMATYSVPSLAFTGIRHVVWEHFNFKVNLGIAARSFARQLALCFADRIVTLTARDVQFWKQGAWYRRAQLVHIPNPMFLEEQKVNDSPSKTVISVGRITYQKGFDLLVDAWGELPTELRNEWKLLIIGDGEDKPLLEKNITELGIGSSVELVGATKAVFAYFETASIYCLSSRFEGLPMVLLEALAFHLPIVAFDCDTGPEELIEQGQNGILVDAGNVSKLSQSLAGLMNDDALRGRMRKYKSQRLHALELGGIMEQWSSVLK
ncbi:glycosyltransferase involved in cell wall biosynthesis [Dyadobacter sp. BE34]|uniref:Glycosyltransferase involved in cell wall biosynthesis n=1 Tax=Dyadobacter fermentans TaxID=94254 RepID=A0ABU1QR03_9BACT|nr:MULTISPECIES: glycosyltransferase family 4 protein [Dyadobacter]MDR6803568.1 glycosyltransferase involved in cell wall biosynthesis [Dyadobacter fermentans]MDR7041308.1 glycosyltransferase involved in cell wall biosynthesis [Dyadobacter sp. BE242]MDR7195712.1 glycosyltransferase involved in cell wall biosynthesis [Dyadobacter sp. BE34]MDR7213744.1 glycosyltransferase involved in cell wall biosynthesis [Dyadobacter sp. BE31]MDR7261118.1 glycosyltransferase involved in cell wall biosynthesis 